jgi:uncharacterized protein
VAYLTACIAGFFIGAIALFTGFGVRLLILPVLFIHLPFSTAISIALSVQMINATYRLVLLWKEADWQIVLRFGVPLMVVSSFAGWFYLSLPVSQPLFTYIVFGEIFQISTRGVFIGVLSGVLGAIELIPTTRDFALARSSHIYAGALCGLLGFIGSPGAFAGGFLLRLGLRKNAYIGTMAVILGLIDLFMILMFTTMYFGGPLAPHLGLILTASGASIVGTYVAAKKVRMVSVERQRRLVVILLIITAVASIAGIRG